MDRVPQLVGTRGPLKGQRFTVTENGLIVGRDTACDVVVPDSGVSRQHARVRLHNSAVWVQDEGSRNGVFVDGKRVIRPRELGPGGEMTIREHAFTLEMVPAFSDAPPARSAPEPEPETEDVPLPVSNRRVGLLVALGALLAAVVVYLLMSMTSG